MKKELQDKLVDILVNIQGAASKASDFALEQLPEIAQSYVAYGRIGASVWIAFGLVLMAIGLACFVLARKYEHGASSDSFFGFMGGGYWLALVFGGAGAIQFCYAVNSALLVWMAPKVWLLKEIAALVK